MSSGEVLRSVHADLVARMGCRTMLEVRRAYERDPSALRLYNVILREAGWFRCERPFYNVWPIAYDLISSVTLNVAWSDVRFPYETILFRFPIGHEPHGVASALIHNYSGMLQDADRRRGIRDRAEMIALGDHDFVRGMISATINQANSPLVYETLEGLNQRKDDGSDETVEETLTRLRESNPPPHVEFLYRLAVFTSLLARGEDLITPIVLSKDQKQYAVADPERRQWLEDRAARIQGRGFDLGKSLQQEKDNSPHWRNPHLCLFWTGTGRGTPLLKVRRGGVVIPKALSEVPTGFLGAESPEELSIAEATYTRAPIPPRVRFEILRRDSYRCQLCGRSASDGIRLHIDHKHAASRGGTNTLENLWTLCEPCNLGKSDLSLAPESSAPKA